MEKIRLYAGQKIITRNKKNNNFKVGTICCFAQDSQRIFAITAYHVLQDMDNAVYVNDNYYIGNTEISLCNVKYDIGVIRLSNSNASYSLELAIDGIFSPDLNSCVHYKCDIHNALGIISKIDDLLYIIPSVGTTELSVAGCSGAAWLCNNKLIGMHTRGNNELLFPYDEFARAVPASIIDDSLRRNRLSILFNNFNNITKDETMDRIKIEKISISRTSENFELTVTGSLTLNTIDDLIRKVSGLYGSSALENKLSYAEQLESGGSRGR